MFFWLPRQDGINNQMEDFHHMIDFSHRMDAKLLMPMVFENVQWGRPVDEIFSFPFSHYFELPNNSIDLPTKIGEMIYLTPDNSELKDEIQHRVFKLAGLQVGYCINIKISVNSLEDFMRNNHNKNILMSYSWRRLGLIDRFGPYTKNYENGHGYSVENIHYKEAIKATKLKSSLQSLANEIISKLGDYSSVHLRRGDFKIRNSESDFAKTLYDGISLVDRYGSESFFQSDKYIVDCIQNNINNKIVFIVSDDAPSLCKLLNEKIPTKTFVILDEYLQRESLSDEQVGLVESYIAIKSQVFIGNRYSSFSSNILNRRRIDETGINMFF